jgi:biopolymer transport protein ExbD/biopolymer transport protein TolR
MAFSAPKKGGSSLYQPLSDINVTPLVDVMLVLLIVFMITAPMLATGVKVNLPQAKAAQPLKPHAPVVITIARDGHIQVNGGDTALDVLVDTVKAKLASADDDVIHLRGDKDVAYGSVVAVMDLLANNGLVKIAIVSDSRKSNASAPVSGDASVVPLAQGRPPIAGSAH